MSEKMTLKYGTTKELPITLRDAQGDPLPNFTGRLWFIVKDDLADADEDAIISKEIVIDNADGDPYHGLLSLTLADSQNCVGLYSYDFKIKQGSSDWESSDVGIFEIKAVGRQGNPE